MTLHRRAVRQSLRKAVYQAARQRCHACHSKISLSEMECDHVKQFVKGGKAELSNLRCLCKGCHYLRHGWRGYVTYNFELKCRCRLFVWLMKKHPARIFRRLGVRRPRRALAPVIIIRCRKHAAEDWPDWLKRLRVVLPKNVPTRSRAALVTFVCKADGGRSRYWEAIAD